MEQFGKRIDKYISIALVLSLLFMFVLIFLNVVLRFVFSTGVTFAEELARFAFLWTTFLGAYIAARENQLIGISGLASIVSSRRRWIVYLIIDVLSTIVLVVVLLGAWEILLSNLGGRAPVSGAPVAIAFSAIVSGSAIMLAMFLIRILTVLLSLNKDRGQ